MNKKQIGHYEIFLIIISKKEVQYWSGKKLDSRHT